jgi:hypothetical protein
MPKYRDTFTLSYRHAFLHLWLKLLMYKPHQQVIRTWMRAAQEIILFMNANKEDTSLGTAILGYNYYKWNINTENTTYFWFSWLWTQWTTILHLQPAYTVNIIRQLSRGSHRCSCYCKQHIGNVNQTILLLLQSVHASLTKSLPNEFKPQTYE